MKKKQAVQQGNHRIKKYWSMGRKDGLCNHVSDLSGVHKSCRDAYEEGWVHGAAGRYSQDQVA